VTPRLSACVLCALALSHPFAATAATDADLAEIREQIKSLKDTYETRIRALEARLQAAEAAASAPSAAAAPPANAPAANAPSANTLAAFNPAISLVLQGTYAHLSQDPNQFAIQGFQVSGDTGPGRRGLGLGESELGFFASVDDKFAGSLTLSLTPDNQVSVEEAYGLMTALPYGLTPKFGRFFSGIGYLNDQHQHAWDFQDAPLVYQAFLGGQFTEDGGQIKWVAPTDTFVELGAEAGNGDAFPGSPRNSNGVGSYTVFAHMGGDVGASSSWRAGLSYLEARSSDRDGTLSNVAGQLVDTGFSGTSRVTIVDGVWKYAPNGNARETNFKLQGEYFWRRERGSLTYDRDGALGLASTSDYSASQTGWYLQGVWQFAPMWRVGLRYDRLDPGNPDYGANAVYLAAAAFNPERSTVMFDYTPSEFSRFRVQYAQSKTRPDFTDNQFFLQYILTLGAHGAHKF